MDKQSLLKSFTVLFVLLLFSCNQDKVYQPKDLKKLSLEEVKQLQPSPEDIAGVLYRLSDGTPFPYDSIAYIPNIEELIPDYYVDDNGKLIEAVFRKMTPEEALDFEKQVEEFEANQKAEALKRVEEFETKPVDCNKVVELLETTYALDQDMRRAGSIDSAVDMENLRTVISIIEQWGMPTVENTNRQTLRTIWLVFQHSPPEFIKAYFPMLKEVAEKGDLNKKDLALMEDRVLMYDDQPQIYGSQVVAKNGDGKWELYELKDPQYVDQRREEIGLGPLADYLSRWDITFDIPQKQK